MKRLAFVIAVLFVLAGAGSVLAQQAPGGQPSGSPPASGAPATRPDVDVKTDIRSESRPADKPATGDRRPDVNVNIEKRDQTAGAPGDRGGDGAALPRAAAGERSTIFGLSPTAAILLAAALLVVVILAIVAMTRSGETTYIDRDRI